MQQPIQASQSIFPSSSLIDFTSAVDFYTEDVSLLRQYHKIKLLKMDIIEIGGHLGRRLGEKDWICVIPVII